MAETVKNKNKIMAYIAVTAIVFMLLWWHFKPSDASEQRMAEGGEPEGGGGGFGGGGLEMPPVQASALPSTYRQQHHPVLVQSPIVVVSPLKPIKMKGMSPKIQIPPEPQETGSGGISNPMGGTTGNVGVGITGSVSTTEQPPAPATESGGLASSLNLSNKGNVLVM